MKRNRQARQWQELRETFIKRRLAGELLSLQQYADELGLDRRTVERHSAAENWIGEIGAINRVRLVERLKYLNSLRAGFRTR